MTPSDPTPRVPIDQRDVEAARELIAASGLDPDVLLQEKPATYWGSVRWERFIRESAEFDRAIADNLDAAGQSLERSRQWIEGQEKAA